MRRHVAAVRERVDPCPLGHVLALGELEERLQVVDVGMDAALGDEAEQVDVPAALASPVERGAESLVLVERSVLDRAVHAHEVLEEHPPGADRQMADLGVPHLPGRKPDRLAGCGQGRVRAVRPEIVEHGRVGEIDGVPRPGWREPPAVEDHECDELRHAVAATSAAARQIASNEAGSSEAPPTSAPSTSG